MWPDPAIMMQDYPAVNNHGLASRLKEWRAMQEYSVALGTLEVSITGKYVPLRRLPYRLQEQIVLALIRLIGSNLERRFGGHFEFEILEIDSGCIKGKIRVTWFVIGGLASAVVTYPALKTGAQELWNDGKKVIEYVVEGRSCEARFTDLDFIDSLYGPVTKGETLTGIASKLDCGDFTREQVMVSIFLGNAPAFIDGNMNLLREGALLAVPNRRAIGRISHAEALASIAGHERAHRGT